MGENPLKFGQKITLNHQIEHFVDSMKFPFKLNENLRLFYMAYQIKPCKNYAKIHEAVFRRV